MSNFPNKEIHNEFEEIDIKPCEISDDFIIKTSPRENKNNEKEKNLFSDNEIGGRSITTWTRGGGWVVSQMSMNFHHRYLGGL